jgi:signal transduction histidine kinase
MERTRLALALVGLLAGVGAAWIMLGNEVRHGGAADVVLLLSVGWSFLASGLVAWRLRPDNPIGAAMVATGLLRLAEGPFWSQDAVLFTFGHVFSYAYLAGIGYILLAFPSGRLESPSLRGLFWVGAVAAGPLQVAWLLTGGHDQAGSCAGCPVNLLELTKAPDVTAAIQLSQAAIGTIVAAISIAVLVRRWQLASAPLRFAITPVIWAGVATFAAQVLHHLSFALGVDLGRIPALLLDLTLALTAVAFLLGVARTRLARSAVADLVAELGHSPGPGELRAGLARALRDPSLEIAYWLPVNERFVDSSGKPATMPRVGDPQVVTMVEREGRRIAALVHDPAVTDDESLVRAVAAAAGLQLENERLQAELRSQLEEVVASRARIVEATQDERRRIERNLHDGTQQRLVSIAMALGLADAKVATDADAARRLIAEARGDLSKALEELRELSQGIHPGILTERGLGKAVDELAQRMHLPVEVDVRLPERLPTPVETAAYYVISEALTNIAKHAGASRAQVMVGRQHGRAVIAISDDGRGGADAGHGSGLRGLRDRVEALGGRFGLDSPLGMGTAIRAEIPCE